MPYEVCTPTTREHLSFTQLKVAAACGEAYRRRYVEDEAKGALTVPAVAGSAFHAALAPFEGSWHTARGYGQQVETSRLVGMLASLTRQQVNQELREKGINSEALFHYGKQDMGVYLREKIPAWAERYVAYRQMEHERGFTWGIGGHPSTSIEIESLIEVADHPFVSYIDQIYLDRAGRLVIRDLKTGTPTPGDAMQIEQYRVALKRSHGLEADYGQLLYVGKGEEAHPQVVTFVLTDTEVDQMTGRLLRSIEEHVFMANGPFTGACKNCEFSLDCPFGQVNVHGSS